MAEGVINSFESIGMMMCKNSSVQFYACQAGQSNKPLHIELQPFFPNSIVGEMPWKKNLSPKSWPWSGDDYIEIEWINLSSNE